VTILLDTENICYLISKLNVCTDVLNDVLIGLFFIDDDLTTEKYEAMLRDQIFPTIRLVKILPRYSISKTVLYHIIVKECVLI